MSAPPFQSVWFDCDSTLSAIEGVDELVRETAPELRSEIRTLTERAMNGDLPLAEVYELRLARIAPTRAQLERVGELYVRQALPDAAAVVAALQALGKTVGVVSGGLLPAVAVLARSLGVPASLVQAVPLQFTAHGDYVDFDRRSPLWRNGGKVEVLRARPPRERPLAFVGDGITDLEAKPVVDRFIGFGGIARRTAVEQGADYYVTQPRLAAILPHLLAAGELSRLQADPRFTILLDAIRR